jgi:hypothetical protein
MNIWYLTPEIKLLNGLGLMKAWHISRQQFPASDGTAFFWTQASKFLLIVDIRRL